MQWKKTERGNIAGAADLPVKVTGEAITMRGSSAFEKNYQEKQVFHSKLSAGATCLNEQQLGRLEICSGFLDMIVSQYFTFRTQRIDSKTHNYA